MSETMVERVALEIARKRIGVKPEDWSPNRLLLTTWDVNTARAAIEAMRWPTEEMVDAGAVAEGDGNLATEARNLWSAMIDAALAPASPTPLDTLPSQASGQ